MQSFVVTDLVIEVTFVIKFQYLQKKIHRAGGRLLKVSVPYGRGCFEQLNRDRVSAYQQVPDVFAEANKEMLTIESFIENFIDCKQGGSDISIQDVPGDIEKIWADPSFANTELGWKTLSSLDEAMKTAWDWEQNYRNNIQK